MLNNRTDIINYFIGRYGYKTYLEIGVSFINVNFNKIIVPDKTGVDPNVKGIQFTMTSDDFFVQNKKIFDIIFIDGLHESEQVYRDIVNSINVLNDNGTIIMHDCNPTDEIIQLVPQIRGGEWTGDCWKAFVRFRKEFIEYDMFVIETDYGVGVIRKSIKPVEPFYVTKPLTYNNLEKNRIAWLNLVKPSNVEAMLLNLDETVNK